MALIYRLERICSNDKNERRFRYIFQEKAGLDACCIEEDK